MKDLCETNKTQVRLARPCRLFVKSNFLVNFVCGGAESCLFFETLQAIRLKGASMSARRCPGPVQVHISSPENRSVQGFGPLRTCCRHRYASCWMHPGLQTPAIEHLLSQIRFISGLRLRPSRAIGYRRVDCLLCALSVANGASLRCVLIDLRAWLRVANQIFRVSRMRLELGLIKSLVLDQCMRRKCFHRDRSSRLNREEAGKPILCCARLA